MDPQFLLIPFFLVIIIYFSVLIFTKKKKEKVETMNLPPGPKKLPLIGNLHQLGHLPHKSLHHLSTKYGPLMYLQLGSVQTIVVSSAEMAREIFKTNDLVFCGRPALYAAKKLTHNFTDITFAPYGEYWREVRKIVVIELLSLKRVQSFEIVRREEVAFIVDSIARSSSNPIDLSELMVLFTNNVICRVAFGAKSHKGEGKSGSRIQEIIHEAEKLVGEVNIADYFPSMGWFNKLNGFKARLEKNFKELDNLFDKVLEEHLDPNRPKPNREDLVDVLLQIQKDQTRAITLTDQQVKGIMTDMFIAGTDTSATALVWTMAELIKNPLVLKKAQEEVREVVNEKGNIKESDLSKMVYLKSVIKEALRLHPPAPLLVPRETTETCIIGGYRIPSKARVFINAKSLAMDSNYWENPNEFRPERFLNNSSVDFDGQSFEFLPFGAGRRGCPGINFAILLIELALANLLYWFEWKLPQGMKEEDVDMEEAIGLVMHKKIPLCLVASPV